MGFARHAAPHGGTTFWVTLPAQQHDDGGPRLGDALNLSSPGWSPWLPSTMTFPHSTTSSSSSASASSSSTSSVVQEGGGAEDCRTGPTPGPVAFDDVVSEWQFCAPLPVVSIHPISSLVRDPQQADLHRSDMKPFPLKVLPSMSDSTSCDSHTATGSTATKTSPMSIIPILTSPPSAMSTASPFPDLPRMSQKPPLRSSGQGYNQLAQMAGHTPQQPRRVVSFENDHADDLTWRRNLLCAEDDLPTQLITKRLLEQIEHVTCSMVHTGMDLLREYEHHAPGYFTMIILSSVTASAGGWSASASHAASGIRNHSPELLLTDVRAIRALELTRGWPMVHLLLLCLSSCV